MMVSIDLMGGLGNQLFQIFFLWSYAKKHGREFRLPDRASFLNRSMFWDDFLRSLAPFLMPNQEIVSLPVVYEVGFPWHDYPSFPHPVRFVGYFQSPRYFEHDLSDILRVIGWEERCAEVPSCGTYDASMHFRRGDYKSVQHAHPLLGTGYYKKALETVFARSGAQTLRIIYFYEHEDREDVDELIRALDDGRCAFTDGTAFYEKDWHQLVAMTRCLHSVIANSTFSWWGAYLARDNPDSVRVYPSTWFGPALADKDIRDLFPDSWIKI